MDELFNLNNKLERKLRNYKKSLYRKWSRKYINGEAEELEVTEKSVHNCFRKILESGSVTDKNNSIRIVEKLEEVFEELFKILRYKATEMSDSETDNNSRTMDGNKSKMNEGASTSENERVQASTIGFRDVEYALEPFEGQLGSDVNEWLADFQNVATASCWNDVQKYLFARRLLKKRQKQQ